VTLDRFSLSSITKRIDAIEVLGTT